MGAQARLGHTKMWLLARAHDRSARKEELPSHAALAEELAAFLATQPGGKWLGETLKHLARARSVDELNMLILRQASSASWRRAGGSGGQRGRAQHAQQHETDALGCMHARSLRSTSTAATGRTCCGTCTTRSRAVRGAGAQHQRALHLGQRGKRCSSIASAPLVAPRCAGPLLVPIVVIESLISHQMRAMISWQVNEKR